MKGISSTWKTSFLIFSFLFVYACLSAKFVPLPGYKRLEVVSGRHGRVMLEGARVVRPNRWVFKALLGFLVEAR